MTLLLNLSSDEVFLLTVDASKYAVAVNLDKKGQSVSYFSHRMSETETGCGTGDN